MKKLITSLILLPVIMVLSVPAEVYPCSTMSYTSNNETYLARNYDFSFGHGLIVTNKRNIKKMGLIGNPEYMRNSAKWKSRYGSITFNQFGRELPTGGINEKGLAVEQMWLLGGGSAKPDGRPAVNELQWIQYQLDNYKSVKEMITHIHEVQILSTAGSLHYIACDADDECAVFDFDQGKPIIHHGKNLPLRISTNTFYKEGDGRNLDRDILENISSREKAGMTDSHKRFGNLSSYLKENRISSDPVSYGFNGIDTVKVKLNLFQKMQYSLSRLDPATHWQIVYNSQKKEIHFRTHTSPDIKQINVLEFNFSCKTPVRVLDIDHKVKGNVNNTFKIYEKSDNVRIIDLSYKKWDALPENGQKFLADLPENFPCDE